MSTNAHNPAAWVYDGLWGILAAWFRVPRTPPVLPVRDGEHVLAFHPAPGYLRYIKLQFWVGLVPYATLLLGICIAVAVQEPIIGALLALPAIVLFVVPSLVAYLAMHLRFDTTWYVISERSLRIRHGIWVIREMTFTFENVQNVAVVQGPLQRLFGIADVVVDTAGGGSQTGPHGESMASLHQGRLAGVDNANDLRDLMLERLAHSRSAGLGDEVMSSHSNSQSWPPQYTDALRDIRDALKMLVDER